ncbi:VOC family protein [Kribbella sp. NBC_00382]|uniref:VOC family protein n=1 Tax=Kribbella sp. NBC_00382 TaxID=2975967 RepID=UPI002E1C47D6
MATRMPQSYARGELVIVLDAADLERSADFWSQVLGYRRAGSSGKYLSLIPADGVGCELLVQRVDDVKREKNRLHLDLRTADLEAEVARVVALGATVLSAEPIVEDGWRWQVLADPDGNEFCVLQLPTS